MVNLVFRHLKTHREVNSVYEFMQNCVCLLYWGKVVRDVDKLTVEVDMTKICIVSQDRTPHIVNEKGSAHQTYSFWSAYSSGVTA